MYVCSVPGGVHRVQNRYQACQRFSREEVGLYLPLLNQHSGNVVTATDKKKNIRNASQD